MDSDQQADRAWLLSVQRKLNQWSRAHPDEAYRDLWNWITDLRNLRCAWRRVASNKGNRTPGIDGVTVARIRYRKGESKLLHEIRRELRDGSYKPSPCRRKLIPKRGKPGDFRPLGIPTVKDRVIQSAVKQILEPIFEAQFWRISYGFRPGRGCHGALEHIRMATVPKPRGAHGCREQTSYPWVIEGDIKGCFDHISQHALLTRIRQRIADRKAVHVVRQFLRAGALAEDQFIRTPAGTPQGGIISPLLANIALSALDERYEQWVYHRKPANRTGAQSDGMKAARSARANAQRNGRMYCFPIRYADDFVVLVAGSQEQAIAEKNALAEHLRSTLGLELSAEKTKVTSMKDGFEFLGHRVRLKKRRRGGFYTSLEIPKAKAIELRRKIKRLTGRNTTGHSLTDVFRRLNPILRGWGNFYRHCRGAHRVFSAIDWYVGDRCWRWMRKKHQKTGANDLLKRYRRRSKIRRRMVWQEDGVEAFLTSTLRVERYRLGWMKPPDFAMTSGEPDA